jgi:hypothetical protein
MINLDAVVLPERAAEGVDDVIGQAAGVHL